MEKVAEELVKIAKMLLTAQMRTPEELERAKKADLGTLPDEIEGTNCGNCSFFKDGGYCNHKEVLQPVKARMCCIYWDNPGYKRVQ